MSRPPTILTPARIEALAEARMDTIDRQLMSGKIGQALYDAKVADLSAWIKEYQGYLAAEKVEAQ